MKRVCILLCGGTVVMKRDERGTLTPTEKTTNLLNKIPDLEKIASITIVNVANMDSTNMDPSTWILLIKKIEDLYDQYDGFVVIHGTDTMAYTASALSFSIKPLTKTIVFTGSQKPLSDIATDAHNNIINSVLVALSNLCEVVIVFGTKILRGNRTTKTSESHFDAFESPMYPSLGTIELKPEFFNKNQKKISRKPRILSRFDEKVVVLKIHPGLQTAVASSILSSKCNGVVIEGFGAGNIPDKLVTFLDKAAEKKIPVIIISQCHQGMTKMKLYKVGYQAYKHGAIAGHDMTTEAAIAKLMWILGQTRELNKIRNFFAANIAGEVTLDSHSKYN